MAVAEKFVWTSMHIFKMLEEVERKPCVWKKSDRMYMNKHMKSAAFQEIAATIGTSADSIRDKLRNLRTVFCQINRKKSKSGSGAVQQPRWEFYKAMLFMAGEVTKAGETDSLCFDAISEGDVGENSNESEANMSTSSDSVMKSPALPKSTSKRKRDVEDLTLALNPLYEELSKSRAKIERAKGPNEKFAVEVASVLNNISDQNLVKCAKARMRLILAEVMAESAKQDLAESERHSSTPTALTESEENDRQTQELFSEYIKELI